MTSRHRWHRVTDDISQYTTITCLDLIIVSSEFHTQWFPWWFALEYAINYSERAMICPAWSERKGRQTVNTLSVKSIGPVQRSNATVLALLFKNSNLLVVTLKKIWSQSHSTSDLKLLRSATNHYHTLIIKAKKLHNSTLLSSNLKNPKKTLEHNQQTTIHRIVKPSFPSSFTLNSLSQSFATFFSDKIHKLRSSILSGTTTSSPHLPPAFKPPDLSCFHPATIDKVSALLSSSPDTSCDLDQSLPHSSNNANLFFFPQSLISSTCLCPLKSFLTNLKTVLYIPFSKNPTLTKKTYPTTGQYLTYILPIQTHRTAC